MDGTNPKATAVVPEEFFTRLEAIYSKNKALQGAWAVEEEALKVIVPAVAADIAFNYDLGLPIPDSRTTTFAWGSRTLMSNP